MKLSQLIREIVGAEAPSDLTTEEAAQVAGAVLDGGVPELELGSLLAALATKRLVLAELLGFAEALATRTHHIAPPDDSLRTVVLPTYGSASEQPNLTAVVALVLQRIGVPVLLHGSLEGHRGVATAYVLRELGMLPSSTLSLAQTALAEEKLAFVPTAVLAPGVASLLALRSRLGFPNVGHVLTALIDPLPGLSVRVAAGTTPGAVELLRAFFLATGERAIVMEATEGEAFANPRQRPRIEYFDDGLAEALFEQETGQTAPAGCLPEALDAKAIAAYARRVLDARAALPLPIVNQIACCLYAAGLTPDLNQAKAMAALQTKSLAAA